MTTLRRWAAKHGPWPTRSLTRASRRSKNISALYAGATDLVCIHDEMETVVDFKQANQPKRREWIGDYFLQIAAYAMAHDYVHRSNIQQAIIMLCTADNYYQEFKIQGIDLMREKHKFLKSLDIYHYLKFDEKEQANVGYIDFEQDRTDKKA